MGAIPSTTGAVHVWIGGIAINRTSGLQAVRSGSVLGGVAPVVAPVAASSARPTFTYLGTGERGPRILVKRHHTRVFNDLSGPEIGFDMLWSGKEALVFLDATRWDELVYRAIASNPTPGLDPGFTGAQSVGTLMMTEGLGFPLVLRFPHFDGHPLFRASGMPAGYQFPRAMLVGDDAYETGNAPNKRHLAFHCINEYFPRTNDFQLHTFDVGNVPALAPS